MYDFAGIDSKLFPFCKNIGTKNPLSVRKADFSIIYTKINALSDDDLATTYDVKSLGKTCRICSVTD